MCYALEAGNRKINSLKQQRFIFCSCSCYMNCNCSSTVSLPRLFSLSLLHFSNQAAACIWSMLLSWQKEKGRNAEPHYYNRIITILSLLFQCGIYNTSAHTLFVRVSDNVKPEVNGVREYIPLIEVLYLTCK